VISQGRIVGEGTPRDLKSAVADRTVLEIEVFGATAEAIERLRRAPGVTSVAVEERDQAQLLLVQSSRGHETTQELLRHLDGATVGRVVSREPTLEDAYVALVTAE
jgi:ABC-2 type transport system ATP-binding protein